MADLPTWLHEEFDELNQRFFQGALKRIKTIVKSPPFGNSACVTPSSVVLPDGTRQAMNPLMFIHPSVVRQGRKYVRDTLLHEMIHIALDAESQDGDKDHGERFVARANDLGGQLGLRRVQPGSDEAIDWPQSVRPQSFHGGWK